MSSQEYISKASKKNSIARWLPALGFLLVLALGAVSYVISEPVHEAVYSAMFEEQELMRGIGRGSPSSFMQPTGQYGVAFVIFIVLLLLVGILYAIFAPKPKIRVHESELKKERIQNEQDRRREKLRKQKINKQMAAERERQIKQDEQALKNKRR
jgi:flagellar biosynthesis/type III secretory pathway M-ring protein FliF/YscJ